MGTAAEAALATSRKHSIALLVLAEMAAMSLWFVTTAILPEMRAEAGLTAGRAALLSSSVQFGFVLGALALAIHGTADRIDPRRVFAAAAVAAALCNALLLITPIGGEAQIALRVGTGVCLAGVYPVGMKIAVGWSEKRRGLLVGILVAALTFGSAAPHAIALVGGADWRFTVMVTSTLAVLAGGLILMAQLGPHHAVAQRFDPRALRLVMTVRPLRLAFAGYLCHMWELYAFWAWIATAMVLSFTQSLGAEQAELTARLTAFGAIALGGVLSVPAGHWADKLGRAHVAGLCMMGSALSALATATSFGGAPVVTILCVLVWGALVVPDSAQFSALVADAAPASRAGSLMTLQTALGFLLTSATVQGAPWVAARLGWPMALAGLGIGPVLGVEAMRRLARLRHES